MLHAPTIDLLLEQPEAADDQHLHMALGWLHRLLAWQIDVTRQTFGALADDPYRGLYVPDAEVDVLAAAPNPLPPELAAARAELAAERATIAEISAGSRLARLARQFNLSPFDCDVLLLALAPELDLRYERIYGYIQDDVTKKRPTVSLALRLFCTSDAETLAARARFAPGAPLLAHRLIQLADEGQHHAPLLARAIKLDARIVDELLGLDALDAQLAPYVERSHPQRGLDELVLSPELTAQLRRAAAQPDAGVILALHGGYGSGRKAVAEALCAELGCTLLLVDVGRLLEGDLDPEEGAYRLVREAALQHAALLWQQADLLFGDDERARRWRLALLAALDAHAGLSFLALEQPWQAHSALRHARYLGIDLPPLSFSEREQIWRARLGEQAPDDSATQALASTFRLSPGQIRDAAALARSLNHWHASAPAQLGLNEIFAACRAQSSGRLAGVARRVRATYQWADLVLPAEQATQLREICVQLRHRRTVLEQWGFDRHLAMGKGVNVLFAGPSGTGKTMAAEVIAADLGLELYKIDLSALVSKYIGETEKNLDRIFQAAGEANAILFFDEADAIFGKRSEVKDAHDRYANIEVGYLLQRMEEYDGVVILATNLRKNIDDAFVRRLHVAIDFPFPEETDRQRIWRQVFPATTPLAADVDLRFLARQFKLSGGNIRNIALLAAFLAAEDGSIVTMQHIVRALRREYQKLGKLVTESDFGAYFSLLRPAPDAG